MKNEWSVTTGELRIGITLGIYSFQPDNIGESFFTVDSKNIDVVYRNIDLYHGIILTEDILLKCGFEKRKNSSPEYWYKTRMYNFKFLKWKTSNEIHLSSCMGLGRGIKYLHQLQTLYFSLTGEELQITL